MKSAVEYCALTILASLCLTSAVQAGQASLTAARVEPSNVTVYTGADALRKEMQVVEQVISVTTDRVVLGEANSNELNQLLARRTMLQKALNAPNTSPAQTQSAAISGCGQSLSINASTIATPGGGMFVDATATVNTNSATPAFIRGMLYTIAKDNSTNQRNANVQTFSFDSVAVKSRVYNVASHSEALFSFFSCGKAYATGAISNGSGNPLACNNVPMLVESSFAGIGNDCNLPN